MTDVIYYSEDSLIRETATTRILEMKNVDRYFWDSMSQVLLDALEGISETGNAYLASLVANVWKSNQNVLRIKLRTFLSVTLVRSCSSKSGHFVLRNVIYSSHPYE